MKFDRLIDSKVNHDTSSNEEVYQLEILFTYCHFFLSELNFTYQTFLMDQETYDFQFKHLISAAFYHFQLHHIAYGN